MPFIKLDTGILESTLWFDFPERNVFITALLMAEPFEVITPLEQYEVRNLKKTGFVVPPGWYGFVPAAGIGIIRRSLVNDEDGYRALEHLGSPDPESRSRDFDGRRLVRINGGYIALNYFKYRDRDYTAATRMQRLRARRKAENVTRNGADVTRNVTHSREQRAVVTPPLPPLLKKGGRRKTKVQQEAEVGKWDGTVSTVSECFRCRREFPSAEAVGGIFCSAECEKRKL